MDDLAATTRALAAGDTTASALVRNALVRIADYAALNAFWRVDAEGATAAAAASDARRAAGTSLSPLDGVPLGVKDNFDTAGLATSGGMAAWRDRLPDTDADAVRRLRGAGMIVVGKLAMDEAALGATCINPHFGRTGNPQAPERVPGGSSGGAGAAVAIGLVPAALGSDTAGSVRIPAAYCGVTGFKPSYGLIDSAGMLALSWRLDTAGLLVRRVADLSLLMPPLADGDWRIEAVPLRGMRLGVLEEVAAHAMEPAVRLAFDSLLERLAAAGAEIRTVAPTGLTGALRRAALLPIEADGALALEALLREQPASLSKPLAAMLAYGRDLPSAKLVRAERQMAEAAAAVERAWGDLDALIAPTTPQVAFRHDAPVPADQADFTVLANVTGGPSISLPVGSDTDGMPIGLQLTGRRGGDRALLAVAAAVEAISPWAAGSRS